MVLPSDSWVWRFTQVPGSVIENIKECIRKNETDFTIEIYTIGNYNSWDISWYSTYCYTWYELINSKSTLQQILEKCIKANNNWKYKKMQIIPKDLFIQIKEYYNLNWIEKTIKNFLINNEKTEIWENFNELKISFTIPKFIGYWNTNKVKFIFCLS